MVDVALSILHSAASNLAVDSAPGDEPIYLPPARSQDLGWLRVAMKNHRISSPSPGHQKSWKLVLRPPKNIKNGPSKQQNSNFCEKLVFATPLTPNACFWSPRHPESDPKINTKCDLETSITKTLSLVQVSQKALKKGSRNPPKIDKNPSLDPKVSFLLLPGAPGSAPGPPGCQSGAPGLPNDKF